VAARMSGRVRLDGAWRVRDTKAGSPAGRAWIGATVPGCIHLDLMRARKIPDPFFGTNETQVQWVGERDWEYRRTFSLARAHPALSAERVDLVFEGLDTFAEVRLNGRLVGRSDNMFIPWRFNVRRALKAGRNALVVRFTSPEAVIAGQQRAHPRLARLPGLRPQAFVRKAQCHFGWDWGPRLVTSGIWRPCRLEWRSVARLADVFARTADISDASATVAVDVETERIGRKRPITCSVTLARGDWRERRTLSMGAGASGRVTFTVPNPELWWPNGAGAQPLYNLTVRLVDGDGRLADAVRKRIGIRTVRLVREPDEAGESFILEVNGRPIFCRGANWIPPDSFPPRFTAAKYHRLLTMAVEANMNMLRVWGGGFYEGETFHSLCDELGLLVWQDFMFACSMVPETPALLANVRREAEATVRRLRSHPSLALWCGNNENQWIYEIGWSKRSPRHYGERIYDKALPGICRRLDPTRPYWPGSPFGGTDSNSEDEGDRHNWDAFHGGDGVKSYLADHGRFLSEFGFQSPPTMRTIRSCTTPAERHAQSRTMEHHNKCGPGSQKLIAFIFDDLKLPADFADYVYKGQVMHARAIQAGVEHWRRHKFHTAGTLIWQLNDCWPVTSWSLIDSRLTPKAAYWYARRFFTPVLVSATRVAGGVEVWLVNDALERAGGHLDVSAMTFAGRVRHRVRRDVTVPANAARRVMRIPERRLNLTDPAECVLVAELTVGTLTISRSVMLFEKPRRIAFPEPTITAKVARIDPSNHWLVLTSDVFVKDLCLDFGDLDVDLTDNYLDLLPGREALVAVSCKRPTAPSALRRALRLCWMR